MGFFALAALASAGAELVFDLSEFTRYMFKILDWVIVAVFVVEYSVKLAIAPFKRAFVLNPWHLLDLAIIVAPFLAEIMDSEHLKSSPALRLVRFIRVAMLGARTGGLIARETKRPVDLAARPSVEIRTVVAESPDKSVVSDWDEFVRRMANTDEEWFHLSGLGREDLDRLAGQLGLSREFLSHKLFESAYPRTDTIAGYSTLYVWYPLCEDDVPALASTDRRVGVLMVCSSQNLITLTCERFDLQLPVLRQLPNVDASTPFLGRVMSTLLKHMLERYGRVVDKLEQQVNSLRFVPVHESRPDFLKRTFGLQMDISTAAGDLMNLAQLIRAVAGKDDVTLKGYDFRPRQRIGDMVGDAENLHKRAGAVLENLKAWIELHLNISSFEMNKVMRLLTLVTILAIVPTVIGGLLGMNINTSAWTDINLREVLYGIGVGMGLCLYVFAVKGWLR